ncbi:metallophosphoesterase [Chitinimonas sp.]|uniref:metallophosphoesterase n=1 Tax=Chitinimonas sp. TaxID=1934313 RepID=UPI0035B0C52C
MRRLPFLFIVLALLAALHVYIGSRLLPPLALGDAGRLIGVLLLAASCCLMPLGLLARFIERESLADRLAWLGLVIMGLFSSLLILTLARDIGLLLTSLFLLPSHALLHYSAIAVIAAALLVTLAGYINARRLAQVVEIDVPLANLPDALHGFTIAQISDIHVGPTIKRDYLDRIVDRVNALNADVVAITGDLVDGSVDSLAPHTAPLARLRARHGSFLVTGNHEYYSGGHDWIAEFRRLGLTVLMNEHVLLKHGDGHLLLAGVPDYTAHHFDEAHRSDPQAALANAPANAGARVLLAHQPRSASAAAAAGFDLQLSGHTHGGQFWPWNLFVPLQQPYTAGLNRLQGLWVYVSRGTGYWGPPKRFGAPSEITRLRLVRSAS